ncbi:MAG: hypothetical protein ACLSIH_10710 [Eggerthella lenta]
MPRLRSARSHRSFTEKPSKLRSSMSSMSASLSARFDRVMRRSCGAAVLRAVATATGAGETVVVVMITSN